MFILFYSSFWVSGFGCQCSAPPLARKVASLIKIETFGTRFRNRPLLGFAFRYNNVKM